MKEKHRRSFISFDTVDFYPSISENLLDQALSWASNLAIITKDEISIIKHARKSLLFNDGKPWTKNDSNSLFVVTMGSYDGAEICELVGLFILNKLGQKFGKENIGLYRDDGLAIIKSKSACLADKTRKELHKCFEQFGLKITPEATLIMENLNHIESLMTIYYTQIDIQTTHQASQSSFLHRSTNAFRPFRQMSKLFMKVLLFTKMN